jgi:cupin-like protein
MEGRDLVPDSLLRRWHRLHFWHSLLFKGKSNRLMDRLWPRVNDRLLEVGRRHGPGKVLDLPRVEGISPQEFYANHVVPNRPVVLAGAARRWRCVEEWTPEYFAAQYGNASVLTVEGKRWTPSGSEAGVPLQNYRLADLIDDVKRGGSRYASFYPFFTYHPELVEHLDVAFLERYFRIRKVFPWQRRVFPKLFLGGPGTSTPTHCAGIINLFVQIYGEKQWDLWHPHAAPFLYPEFRIGNNIAGLVDFRDPDYAKCPLYQYPDRYRTVLEPGDILFVPAWWWHAVQNLTATISVSNFVARMRSTKYGMSFCTRAMLDPWTIAVFLLANEDAEKEWEITLPKLLYSGSRAGYWGTVANFARFVVHNIRGRLGLGQREQPPIEQPGERSGPPVR